MSAKAGLTAAALSAQLGVEIKSEQEAKQLVEQHPDQFKLAALPIPTIFHHVYHARKIDDAVFVLHENDVVLSVDATKTGTEIKKDLAAKLGIEVGRQTLHYKGRRLADNQALSSRKVSDGTQSFHHVVLSVDTEDDQSASEAIPIYYIEAEYFAQNIDHPVFFELFKVAEFAVDQFVSARKGKEISKDRAAKLGSDVESRRWPKVAEGGRSSLVWGRGDDGSKPTYYFQDENLPPEFDYAVLTKVFREMEFQHDQSVSAQKDKEIKKDQATKMGSDVGSQAQSAYDKSVFAKKVEEIKKDPAAEMGSDMGDQTVFEQKDKKIKKDSAAKMGSVDGSQARLADDKSGSAQKDEDIKKDPAAKMAQKVSKRVPSSVWGAGPKPIYYIKDDDLDPLYDFDFTNFTDVGWKFERGGHEYKRPCGWDRCALKVRGRYSDDVWLGETGCRTRSSPGEWAVSYHGTAEGNIGSIAGDGYDTSKSRRQAYGPGIYSTPSIEVASWYAKEFTYGGKQYKVVLQNRVDLTGGKTEVIPAYLTGAGAEYFVTQKEEHIRPYGVCIRRPVVKQAEESWGCFVQ